MAHYLVKTQSFVNEMLLHSTMEREFSTENIDEARAAFAKEVQVLEATYITADKFEYQPNDQEAQHAIFCEIIEVVYNDDGEVEDILSVEKSDLYYER